MDSQEEYLKLLLGCELEIRAFLGSIIRGPHDCDDLFQEVALTLWKEFHRYDRERPFGAWARGIATMKLRQLWDQNRRRPALLAAETIQAIADAFDRSEESTSRRAQALEKCLELLPDKSRKLLELRYERALKIEQIAHELQRTLDAVYQSLSRLRVRLQECVDRRISTGGVA